MNYANLQLNQGVYSNNNVYDLGSLFAYLMKFTCA